MTRFMDTAFLIPGTQIRFGLDALIGLIPGIGDAITTAISLYIVSEARALGAPRLSVRMLANVALDGLVGAVSARGRCVRRGVPRNPPHHGAAVRSSR